ncbi:MAG: FkbM family methyltransferase [Lentisphaerota bacterium]
MKYLKSLIKEAVYSLVPPPSRSGMISYSQAGEDLIMNFLFMDKNIDRIEYLDIGTNLPDICNNTFMFYVKGNHGVCVEANPELIEDIKSKRVRDKVINAGVSVKSDYVGELYIFDSNQISTFNKNEADKRINSGKYKIIDTVKVPMVSINRLIKENFKPFPHLLSLDIEGLDFEVIKTLDFDLYPIPVICMETCAYSENHIRTKDNSILDFMESKDYEVYADTYINTIFVNRTWFYS